VIQHKVVEVRQDQQELQVTKDLQHRQGLKVIRGQQHLQGLRVSKVLRVLRVIKDHRVTHLLATKVLRGHKVLLVVQGIQFKDQQDLVVQLDRVVIKDQPHLQDLKVSKV
jgi:histidine ammonia-lyase